MTQAIKTNVIIGSIRFKVDNSLSFACTTPELTPQEAVSFSALKNKNIVATFLPLDEPPQELISIDKEVEQKSQGERIRAILWLLWKQNPEGIEDFHEYYRRKTEKYIDMLKSKLEGAHE